MSSMAIPRVMETPLGKVLRLAAANVRSYQRVVNGRTEVVSQYAQRRGGASLVPGAGVAQAMAAARQRPAVRSQSFGSLKAGQVVQVQSNRYNVVRTNIPNLTTRNAGQNLHTGGPSSTASMGQAVNTGPPSPQKALLGASGAKVRPGTPTMTSEWRDAKTGKAWFITLPTNFPVQVVG